MNLTRRSLFASAVALLALPRVSAVEKLLKLPGRTIDWTTGPLQTITLVGHEVISFIPPSEPGRMTLRVLQAGQGSVSWPRDVKWADGVVPVLSDHGSTDYVTLLYGWPANGYLAASAVGLS